VTRPAGVLSAAGSARPPDAAVLAEHVRLTLVRLRRSLRRNDPPGLTATVYSALAALADHGELAIGELAEAERILPPTATRIADTLEAAGWIVRQPNPDDRRGVILAVTAAGRQHVQDRCGAASGWLASRLAGLTDVQRLVLAEALAILDSAACDDRAIGPLGQPGSAQEELASGDRERGDGPRARLP
jgi:DNA-binding MarR family transcriptional regulator